MTRNALMSLIRSPIGTMATHKKAKAPQTVTGPIKILQQSTSKAPEAIVNAYGVNGREFVILASDLPDTPEKFDTITSDSGVFVINDVIPLMGEGIETVIGYRCYSKGK